MKEKTLKKWMIASVVIGAIGFVCFMVRIIESFTREYHAWSQTFLILGIVFMVAALLVLVGVIVASNIMEKVAAKNPKPTDEEILAKYKKSL